MAEEVAAAIIGAGPYGLSAAAHLLGLGVDAHVIGQPMEFWTTQMPVGMFLRSHFEASSISDPGGRYSFPAYARAFKKRIGDPVPIEDFIDYGRWFQQHAVPDLDTRRVRILSHNGDGFEIAFEDGDSMRAHAVVLALGLGQFAHRPPEFAEVPVALAPHTSQLSDLSSLRGQRVAVIGFGQSGMEYAALIREQGAEVHLVGRSPELELMGRRWRIHVFRALMPGPLRRLSHMIRPPTDVGDFRTARVIANPERFRQQPAEAQEEQLGAS